MGGIHLEAKIDEIHIILHGRSYMCMCVKGRGECTAKDG